MIFDEFLMSLIPYTNICHTTYPIVLDTIIDVDIISTSITSFFLSLVILLIGFDTINYIYTIGNKTTSIILKQQQQL